MLAPDRTRTRAPTRAPLSGGAAFACALLFTTSAGAQQSEEPYIPSTVSSPEAEAERAAPGSVAGCEPEEVRRTVRVLLLDLEAAGSDQRLARTLGQAVAEEAARVDGFELLSNEELRALLDAEAQKAFAGCDDQSCLAEIASALDAELLISGTFDRTEGSAPTITLSLLNTRALVTVNRVTMAWPGEPGLLPDVARAAAQRLVFEGEQRRPGALVIDGLPPGARVFLSDEDVTDALEEGVLEDLDVGPYHLRIAAEGYVPHEQDLLIRAGEETAVDGALASEPATGSTWWIWVAAGTAAAAVVGGVLGVAALTGGSAVTSQTPVNVPGLADVETVKP